MSSKILTFTEASKRHIQNASYGLRYTPKVELPPELLAFDYDPKTSNDEIQNKLFNNKILAAKIIGYNNAENCFVVRLNETFTAKLPFSHSTIQEFFQITNADGLAPYGRCLLSRVVGVQLLEYDSNCFYVTRMPILERTLPLIQELYQNPDSVFLCTVINVSPKSLFVDMGGGIMGHISISNSSRTKCHNLLNWIKKDDVFFATRSALESTCPGSSSFELSRKDIYYQLADYSIVQFGQPLIVKVGEQTANSPGYFVEITPGINGTLDTSEMLNEGICVTAYLRKIRQHTPRKGEEKVCIQPFLYHLQRCSA